MSKLQIKPDKYNENKIMVRFWTADKKLYEKFKAKCLRENVSLSGAFTQFMEWYVENKRQPQARQQ